MAKFKVGDKARVVYIKNGPTSGWHAGAVVTVVLLSDNSGYGTIGDYTVRTSIGDLAYPYEDQLEPIIKKQELSTWEEIQKLTNWNPEKVKI